MKNQVFFRIQQHIRVQLAFKSVNLYFNIYLMGSTIFGGFGGCGGGGGVGVGVGVVQGVGST